MVARGMRTETLIACVAGIIVAALTPAHGAWVHPSAPGSSNSGGQVVVGATSSKTLNASTTSNLAATDPIFSAIVTANASATATSAGTATTSTIAGSTGNGSTGATTQTVTAYGPATSIVVQLNLNFSGIPVGAATFNFANLNSAAQTTTLKSSNGYALVATATPNAASNAVAISYSLQSANSSIPLPPGAAVTLPSATLSLVPPGSTFAASASGASAPQQSVAVADASAAVGDVVAAVGEASSEAQAAIQACDTNTGQCIADVFDTYAAKLEALAPRLPPQLRELPRIVREAARKIRAAKTRTAAVNAVKSAIAQVNKTIALLKVDDPNAVATGVPVGRQVDQTLEVAEVKLLRSTGL